MSNITRPVRWDRRQRIGLLTAALFAGSGLTGGGTVASAASANGPEHVRVRSSVGYPFHIGEWDSVKVVVDFQQTFTTVSQVCLVGWFEDGHSWTDWIRVDYREGEGYSEDAAHEFLTFGVRSEAPTRMRVCSSPTADWSPLTPDRWRDGREVLYVEGGYLNNNDDGEITITRLDALIYE